MSNQPLSLREQLPELTSGQWQLLERELNNVVANALDGRKVDVQATLEHMLSKDATENQIMNMELEADDTNTLIDDLVDQATDSIRKALEE